LDQIIFPLSK